MIVTSEHRMDDLTATISSQGITPAPTVIEDGVWLGANVLVRAGITVGAGAVIGANSVVTRDVAPGTVAVGAPGAPAACGAAADRTLPLMSGVNCRG